MTTEPKPMPSQKPWFVSTLPPCKGLYICDAIGDIICAFAEFKDDGKLVNTFENHKVNAQYIVECVNTRAEPVNNLNDDLEIATLALEANAKHNEILLKEIEKLKSEPVNRQVITVDVLEGMKLRVPQDDGTRVIERKIHGIKRHNAALDLVIAKLTTAEQCQQETKE
jgi:hypothetical protein